MAETAENVYARLGVGFIVTYTGREFRLDDPTFHIEDIAHALSNTCRYGGHSREFYSVAQHSIFVADLMQRLDYGNPQEGLLHDGTEAYMSDVPAPFKQFLPDWSALDNKLEDALRSHYGIGPKTAGCKSADWLALYIEAYDLCPGKGASFLDPQDLRPLALELMLDGWRIDHYMSPYEAASAFVEKFYELNLEESTADE